MWTESEAGAAKNPIEGIVADLISGHTDYPNDWTVEYDESTKEFVGEFPEWFISETLPEYAETQAGCSFTFTVDAGPYKMHELE